jgi:hypothetical protein
VVADNGSIYISATYNLYGFSHAMNSTNQLVPPAKSSWPMFRANAQHTGRVQKVN